MKVCEEIYGKDKRIISSNGSYGDEKNFKYMVASNGFEGESANSSFTLVGNVSIKGEGDAVRNLTGTIRLSIITNYRKTESVQSPSNRCFKN